MRSPNRRLPGRADRRPSRLGTAAWTLAAVFGVLLIVGLIRLSGLGFVVTSGTSMAPRFHTGDLAITQATSAYHPGDIVAYHSGLLKTVVLHRIVGTDGDRFVTQGDNNTWTDPDRPGRTLIEGRLLARVPAVGRWLPAPGQLVSAATSPLLAIGTLLLLYLGLILLPSRRPRHRRRSTVPAHASPSASAPSPTAAPFGAPTALPSAPATRRAGLFAALVGLVGLVLLAIGAVWMAPGPVAAAPAAAHITTAGAQEQLAIGYSGHTAAVATYPGGMVRTGDSIFIKAVHDLSVSATYTGTPGTPVTVEAELGHPSGWHRPVPMSDPTASTGTVSRTLDIGAITGLLRQFADETGLPGPGTTLTLIAHAGSWTTRGQLMFDGVQFQASPSTFVATRTVAGVAISGVPVPKAIRASVLAPLGRLLPTPFQRVVATLGLLLVAAAGAHAVRRRLRSASEHLPADRLIPVATHTPAAGRTIVDLVRPREMTRIADDIDLPIFQTSTPEGDTFLVDDGTVVYRLHQHTEPQQAIQAYADPHMRILVNVSEELRGPLAAILGYAEILADEPAHELTAFQRSMLAGIDRGATRLQQLGDNLTMLTSLEAGTAQPPAELVDLGALIDDRCEPLRAVLASRQISIDRQFDGALPRIPGDAVELSRALDELLGNAVNTSGYGSTITVAARRDKQHLTVTVTGTPGPDGQTTLTPVPPREQPQRRSDLGLALANAVASHHRGQVSIASHAHNGQTARLELPVA